ncbi:radical SAM protein [archaeon]|nr:radical SAM protein [archaeon]
MKHNLSDKERVFTSTGEKLLYHPEAMKKFQETGIATPIVMHIMPTSNCNLRCNFCSVKDRENHENLSLEGEIKPVVDELSKKGLKSIILSGGGEPMIYKEFEPLINYLSSKNLEIGMITNGTLLKKFPDEFYENFSWIRISINSLENGGKVIIPKAKNPIIGFSYVTNPLTTKESLEEIKDLAIKNNIKYVRVLPDCAQPGDKLEEDHIKVNKLVEELGQPLFHQYKVPSSPKNCYLGFFHPVLYCDGNVYPCDSLVLNDHENQQFKKEFIISSAKDIGKLYEKPVYSLVNPKVSCPNCVFERQNNLLENILDGKIKNFNSGEIIHKNFI